MIEQKSEQPEVQTGESLARLHQWWLGQLQDLIASGADPMEAVETMATVAITNQVSVRGPVSTAHALQMMVNLLLRDAPEMEQRAAEAKAQKH